MDPDIVAAMDEDFDFDDPSNELEDNFMELANAEMEEDFSSDFDESEAMDEVTSLEDQFSFRDEETKSRFTDYSMSSSVMKRNNQLTLLDDRFEKVKLGIVYFIYNDLGGNDFVIIATLHLLQRLSCGFIIIIPCMKPISLHIIN